MECLVLVNETSISHFLLPRLKDHSEQGVGKSVRFRAMDADKETVSSGLRMVVHMNSQKM